MATTTAARRRRGVDNYDASCSFALVVSRALLPVIHPFLCSGAALVLGISEATNRCAAGKGLVPWWSNGPMHEDKARIYCRVSILSHRYFECGRTARPRVSREQWSTMTLHCVGGELQSFESEAKKKASECGTISGMDTIDLICTFRVLIHLFCLLFLPHSFFRGPRQQ